jgi:hypothetical protein
MWALSVETIRRVFENEPDVLKMPNATGYTGRRRYKTLRISGSRPDRMRWTRLWYPLLWISRRNKTGTTLHNRPSYWAVFTERWFRREPRNSPGTRSVVV